MAQIRYPSSTEVQLRLGPQENAILTVVRGWGWWQHAEVEGHVPNDAYASAVVLTAKRTEDRTIREILYRSFRLVFPDDGGDGVATAAEPVTRKLRHHR